MTAKPKKSKAEAQSQRFIKSARELECDEDEKAFDDKLRRIGQAPPHKADEKDRTPEK